MGLIIAVGDVSNLSANLKESINQVRTGLESTKSKVQSFTRDTTQQGASWDGMRSHLSDYEMIITAFIMACQSIEDDCDGVIADVQNGISPDTRLDEDQLKSTIEDLQKLNAEYESICDNCQSSLSYCRSLDYEFRSYEYEDALISSIARYSGCIESNCERIIECEAKLERLYETQAMTEQLFIDAKDFFNCAMEGLKSVDSSFKVDLLGRPDFTINNNAKWRDTLYSLYARTMFTNEELEKTGLTPQEIYELTNDPYVIGLEGTNFFYELLESFNGGNVCQYVLKGSHDFLDVRNSFNLLSDGVSFFVTKLPNGKYALKLSGSIVSGKTRAELMDYLADNITSVNWRKYQTKLFTRGGLGFSEKEFGSAFKNIKYGPLNEYLNFATKGGTEAFSQLKVTGNIVKDTWSANWGDHIKNITEFSDASNVDKVIKGLGIAGDVLTIGTNVKENMFDKDGHVVINTHSLVETVGDIGFDMAADAGGAAAGAAVGSFFAPPLGTVVGAGVGLLISCAGNIDVYDVDKDGEKDSIMDMGHKAIDKVCDFFWGED